MRFWRASTAKPEGDSASNRSAWHGNTVNLLIPGVTQISKPEPGAKPCRVTNQGGVPNGIWRSIPRRLACLLVGFGNLHRVDHAEAAGQRGRPCRVDVFDRVIESVLRLQAVQGRLRANQFSPSNLHTLPL